MVLTKKMKTCEAFWGPNTPKCIGCTVQVIVLLLLLLCLKHLPNLFFFYSFEINYPGLYFHDHNPGIWL